MTSNVHSPSWFADFSGVLVGCRFFGRTWVSKTAAVSEVSREGVTLSQQCVSFRTRVHDESCVAVVEYVLCVKDRGVVVDKYAVGWTVLNVFDRAGMVRCVHAFRFVGSASRSLD